jgi:hypothetical protein
MKLHGWLIILFILFLAPTVLMETKTEVNTAMKETLNPHLEVFRPYIGKTWKGEFKESTPEKPMFDISRWDRVLNGQAIRVLHSVNDGEYGGESIIMWDAKKNRLAAFYFTTAGFFTESVMTADVNKFTAHEMVTGEGSGITEVKSTTEIIAGSGFHTKAQYLQNGEWVDGHEIRYVEYSEGRVIFK